MYVVSIFRSQSQFRRRNTYYAFIYLIELTESYVVQTVQYAIYSGNWQSMVIGSKYTTIRNTNTYIC